jgi:hypothetical protein
MKNLRELFNLYHAGFQDFGPWLDHHREMHRRHLLDVPEFGAEWLRRWETLGKLLEAPACLEVRLKDGKWYQESRPQPLSAELKETIEMTMDGIVFASKWYRVVLLDGTIIREWGPK